MKWLRKMVESRIVAKGRADRGGHPHRPDRPVLRAAKPENYANGRVPWTYFASPPSWRKARPREARHAVAEPPTRHQARWVEAGTT
jgi:hypothetical protein